jgi:RimJ/RimL family protein N-acetyltransferase
MPLPYPFSSARLEYRAVRPADKPLFAALTADTTGHINSSVTNIKLPTESEAYEFMNQVADNYLLGVVIWVKHLKEMTKEQRSELVEKSQKEGKQHMHEEWGTAIGEVHLSRLSHGKMHHRSTEIGITILPEYQNRGYGGETINWVLHYAFWRAGLHRVSIRSFEWNTGAIRLYEKLGFKHEGREREAYWHEGRFWDGVQMGMLEGEWRGLQKAKDESK